MMDKFRIRRGRNFTQEQEEYLTKKSTLEKWACKSLDERVRLFHQRYPNTKTSTYKIRKLYYKHKIKRKFINISKKPK